MSKRTLKQHYVSEFYIRNFSRSSKGIFSEILASGKKCPIPISNIAQEHKYYDIEIEESNLTEKGKKALAFEEDFVFLDGEMRVLSLERWFKKNEDVVAGVFRKIIADRSLLNLSIVDREHVAFFVSSLLLRGPKSRTLFNEKVFSEGIKDEYFKKPISTDMKQQLEWEVAFVNCIDECAKNILNRAWSIIIPNGDVKFLTSDNPVVLYLPLEYRKYSPNGRIGIKTPMVQIFLPICRSMLLQLNDYRYYENMRLFPDRYEICSERVAFMNELQRKQATNVLFIGDN